MAKNSSPFLILSLLVAVFFYDVVFLGKTLSTSSLLPGAMPSGPYGFTGHRPAMPFSFDTGGDAWVNEPDPYIIRQVLSGGSFPAWNPLEGLGMPLIGNLNTEVFNPLKIFLNLFPNPFFQDIFFLLRLLALGIFTYLFLREMKLFPLSCLAGSSFFMLSGYSVWWINLHPLSTVMYLPAAFYFYERWSNRADLKSALLMSLCLSFSLAAGKIPDVIMGLCLLFLYAIWKGMVTSPSTHHSRSLHESRGGESGAASGGYRERRAETGDILRSVFKEGGKITLVTISGALMAAVALLPFLELYSYASPLAKAIRTGASSHTIPLIRSVSFFQPLFLDPRNYVYGSWLKWTPDGLLPHVGLVIAVLSFYTMLNVSTLKRTFPYLIFSLFLFLTVFGLVPSDVVSQIPLFRSIEFLKYNAMLYFSLAVMSACAFDNLMSFKGVKKKLNLSIAAVSLLVLVYFFFLYRVSPLQIHGRMIAVLLLSFTGMIILGLAFHFSKKRQIFGVLVFAFLIVELFIYMPKDHPDRIDPYKEPPYLHLIKEGTPYRFSADGSVMPPLVSNAFGVYDIRAISVLLPGDYYSFFQSLLSFSLPQTNNPDTLFLATSPFTDLAGVKYIASLKPLEYDRLGDVVRYHVAAMRWIRLFDSMSSHSIRGGATYGSFQEKGEVRPSFFFPMKFILRIKLRVTEPFVFAGFALRNAPKGANAHVRITLGGETTEVLTEAGRWNDRWIDVSRYLGKEVTLTLEGDGSGEGTVALGDFGLSPGSEEEKNLIDSLLVLHKKEIDFLKYKGAYEGIHIYENTNVMDRAFVVHREAPVGGLKDVIRQFQEGKEFRDGRDYVDKVVIRKYAPEEVVVNVESGGGLLVLSDLYYPGWRVKVNGREEKTEKVYGLFRGVVVGKGRSEVSFYYRPWSLYVGCLVSLISLVVWIVALAVYGRRA